MPYANVPRIGQYAKRFMPPSYWYAFLYTHNQRARLWCTTDPCKMQQWRIYCFGRLQRQLLPEGSKHCSMSTPMSYPEKGERRMSVDGHDVSRTRRHGMRRLPILILLGGGIVLSLLVLALVRNLEQQRLRVEFTEAAEDRIIAVRTTLA